MKNNACKFHNVACKLAEHVNLENESPSKWNACKSNHIGAVRYSGGCNCKASFYKLLHSLQEVVRIPGLGRDHCLCCISIGGTLTEAEGFVGARAGIAAAAKGLCICCCVAATAAALCKKRCAVMQKKNSPIVIVLLGSLPPGSSSAPQ